MTCHSSELYITALQEADLALYHYTASLGDGTGWLAKDDGSMIR